MGCAQSHAFSKANSWTAQPADLRVQMVKLTMMEPSTESANKTRMIEPWQAPCNALICYGWIEYEHLKSHLDTSWFLLLEWTSALICHSKQNPRHCHVAVLTTKRMAETANQNFGVLSQTKEHIFCLWHILVSCWREINALACAHVIQIQLLSHSQGCPTMLLVSS